MPKVAFMSGQLGQRNDDAWGAWRGRGIVLFAALMGGLACSPGEGVVDVASLGPVGAEALSAVQIAFPEQSPSMLLGLGGFVAAEEANGSKGFRLDEPSGRELPTSAWLPQRAGEPMRLSFRDGFELQVREQGVEGEGKLTGGVVSYRRAEGTAFWHGSAAGAEEWLYLPEGSATVEVATWEVEGGTLRQHGRAVDVYDAEGRPRVTVAAPAGYTADGSDVPLRLVVRGDSIVLTIEAPTREALLLDPVWVSAGSMATARASHTATLLLSGEVLVAGGSQNSGLTTLSSVELYDPGTGTWSPTGTLTKQRSLSTLTLLGNGMVLAAGGSPYGNTAEVYDPASATWTATPPMSQSRAAHIAIRLLSGSVLVAGGYVGAELYDPSTNSWTTVASPNYAKIYHAATMLPDSTILTATGSPNGERAEIYDPASDVWTPIADMQDDRQHAVGLTLLGGRSIFAGGYKGFQKTTVEVYDPSAGVWIGASPMAVARYGHAGVVLSDGRVLVIGGIAPGSVVQKTTELYDSGLDVWSSGPPMVAARAVFTATLLPNDRVLVAGGTDLGTDLATAELLMGNTANGAPCLSNGECLSLHCADGVCCNAACNAGPCEACTAALGASASGTCTQLTGTACDDGNACTQTDACQIGVCVGGNPVVCPAPQECHDPGVCNSATGVCSNNVAPDGTPCVAGTCLGGMCISSTATGGGAGSGGESAGTGGNGGFGGAGLGGVGGYGGAGMGGSGGVGGVGIGGAGGFGGAAEGTGGRETSQGGAGEAVSSTTGSVTGAGGSTSDGGATSSSGEEAAVDSGGCSCRTAPSRRGGLHSIVGLLGAGALMMRRKGRPGGKQGWLCAATTIRQSRTGV